MDFELNWSGAELHAPRYAMDTCEEPFRLTHKFNSQSGKSEEVMRRKLKDAETEISQLQSLLAESNK